MAASFSSPQVKKLAAMGRSYKNQSALTYGRERP